MSVKKPLTKIAPCPCGCSTGTVVETMTTGFYRVRAKCGFSGPTSRTKRGAINAWNRRAKDAEAERRGAMAAVKFLEDEGAPLEYAARRLRGAIERGEVLRAKKGKSR